MHEIFMRKANLEKVFNIIYYNYFPKTMYNSLRVKLKPIITENHAEYNINWKQ